MLWVFVLVFGITGVNVGAQMGTETPQEPRVKKQSKIPDAIHKAVGTYDASKPINKSRGPLASGGDVQVDATGNILIELHAAGAVGANQLADVEALGATIVMSTADMSVPPGLGVIVAWSPPDQLEAVEALDWVVTVRPVENNPPDVGPNESEGVFLHDADMAQARGIDGTGVTVGVISDGVESLSVAQAAGDLPAGVTVLDAGSGDEGTAMLEIVHDMAPGAALVFHATGDMGTMSHMVALEALVAAGVDVITEDIAFDAEPAFQKGIVADHGDRIAASGVSMHSSAGNQGANHAARVLAIPVPHTDLGDFTGKCPRLSPGDNVVDIDPGAGTSFDVKLPKGTDANPAKSKFTLQWSEPRAIFPTAGAGGFTDLNLHLMDAAGTTCLASSTSPQGYGAGDTIEQVSLINRGPEVSVKIVVSHFGSFGAVAAPTIDLRWRGARAIDKPTREGSLNPDANYTGLATSAAAANAGPSDGSVDRTLTSLESSSSGGPVELFLTTVCPGHPVIAGNYPCQEGVPGPPPITIGAPNWTAADGVAISGAGGFGRDNPTCPAGGQGECLFFGTSAAAPHAAACDALVRQANGAVSVADVNAILEDMATDRGPVGFDNAWGAGVLDCGP